MMKVIVEDDVGEHRSKKEEAEVRVIKPTTRQPFNATNAKNLDTINMSVQLGENRQTMQSWVSQRRCFLWPMLSHME